MNSIINTGFNEFNKTGILMTNQYASETTEECKISF